MGCIMMHADILSGKSLKTIRHHVQFDVYTMQKADSELLFRPISKVGEESIGIINSDKMKRDAENVQNVQRQAEMVKNDSKQKTRFLWGITIIALIGIGFCASTIVFAIKLKNSYPSSHVKYHVWGHTNPLQATRNKHNNLKVPKNSTMFITMELAALTASHFRFEYVQYEFGKFVKSIGGISEDVPNNKFWILYELNEDPNPNNPPTSDQMSEEGVDDLRVEHNKMYLFWLTQFTSEEGMSLLKNRVNKFGALASNCQSAQKVTEL